jgi:hypothetical protein
MTLLGPWACARSAGGLSQPGDAVERPFAHRVGGRAVERRRPPWGRGTPHQTLPQARADGRIARFKAGQAVQEVLEAAYLPSARRGERIALPL